MILTLIIFCIICLKHSFFIGRLLRLIDEPNKRKIHKQGIPNFGGLLFVICSIIIFLFLYISDQLNINFESLMFINIALFFMSLLGYFDDIKNVSPYKRTFIFLIFFLILISWNDNLILKEIIFKNFFINRVNIGSFSILLTVFCLFLFYNSFNFSDGTNGIALFSAIFYLIYLLVKINYVDLYILFNLLILIIIFIYNVKSKVFIGNSGSSAISIFLGLIIIYFYNNKFNLFADQIVFLLIVPGLDMVRVTIERLLKNMNPFFPDKTHLHHLLMYLINKKNVWIIYSLLSLIPILFYELGFNSAYILFFSFIFYLLFIYYLKKIPFNKKNNI